MKNKIPQILVIVALVIVISIGLPSSFAKYSGTKTYSVKISKKTTINFDPIFIASSENSATTQKITLPKAGKYLIVAKGGDGGNAVIANGTTAAVGYINGGTGGLMATYITITEKTDLYVYVGTPGKDAKIGAYGSGGTSAALGKGGDGGDTVNDGTLGTNSPYAASGGGGAATSIFIESNDDSKTIGTYTRNYSNLLCVAAGGGGAASWDMKYAYPGGTKVKLVGLNTITIRTYPSGMGGSGGSNVIGSKTTANKNNTNVFDGIDGTDASKLIKQLDSKYGLKDAYISCRTGSNYTYGRGGSTTGGTGGSSETCAIIIWARTGSNYAGGSYSGSDNSGKGGNDEGQDILLYGGGGGGGYCGGGAGVGCSIDQGAGGGGGGSSYLDKSSKLATVTPLNNSSFAFPTIKDHSFSIATENYSGNVLNKTLTSYKFNGTVSASFDRIYDNGDIYKNGFVYVEFVSDS